jgi:multisubunit Na+/H+ antiporter MnhG subunit
MLAKRQFDPDALAATASDEAARRERLQTARLVNPGRQPAGGIIGAAAEPASPRWHRAALLTAVGMAILLLVIGLWAVGAIIYMHNVSPLAPNDVHYPLISWNLEAGPMGDYTSASVFIAWTMLLCLPVAAMLLAMAYLLWQKSKQPE